VSAAALVCPRCHRPAPPGSRFCEEDGARLTETAAPPTVVPTPASGCRCDTPNDAEGSGFCETCGLRIRHSQIVGPAVLGAELAIVTDIGKRHWRNEDAGAIARELLNERPAFVLVVCDGVSSASASDQLAAAAAASAREALVEVARAGPSDDAPDSIVAAIRTAHRDACALKLEPEPGKDPPGATIVAAVAWPGRVIVSWLGDSRAYWLDADGALALTRDDSWVAEAIAGGELSEQEAAASPQAHAITHCIGPLEGLDPADPTPPISPHLYVFSPATAGTLLLCSDGLWNYAPRPDQLAALVQALPAEAEAETIARALVQFALDRGGQDNVTVAVAQLPLT
jgi:PPM family protein phosphatase